MYLPKSSTAKTRFAAIGILFAALYVAWNIIILPYFNLLEKKSSQVYFLQQQHSRLQLLKDNRDMITLQKQQLDQNQTFNDLFLAEKAGALSDAKFQKIVRQLITENRAKLVQINLMDAQATQSENASSNPESRHSMTLRVIMQGDIEAIYATLHGLENNRPLMILNNLEISYTQGRYQIGRTSAKTVYTVSYNVTAFVL